jgi:hypothetical protein
VINKFANGPRVPIKARVDIEPSLPDQRITIMDVLMCIGAFTGNSYPGLVPPDCP